MRKITLFFAILYLFSLPSRVQSAYAFEGPKSSPLDVRPIYLVFLMDSSGSMKKTDPEEIRKLATQVVVTLISPDDKIAVVEFDSDARVLSDWRPASEREKIFSAINQVGNTGSFTDFRAGLESAKNLLIKAPEQARKIVLLLSDGVLEPDPYSDKYAPYNIQYRLAIRGKDKAEITKINEEFRAKLTPVAKRVIDSDILPILIRQGIEIYTVGLSPDADKVFLNYLADKTNTVKTESHYFYTNEAIDLMETFVGLLHCWENKMKLYIENGEVIPNYQKKINFDSFLRDISFVVLTEIESEFMVNADSGYETKVPIKGTHPKLKIIELGEKTSPGGWTYGFITGSGKYKLLITGNSTIDMGITGLKEKYAYGETLKAIITLKFKNQDARNYITPTSKVMAEILTETTKEASVPLQEIKEGFSLEYNLRNTGLLKLRFTLYAFDKQGKEMLPRPSKEYRVEVLPRFYVEPDYINFGDIGSGKEKEKDIKIFSGLSEVIRVQSKSVIKNASRCLDTPNKLPHVKSDDFSISPAQALGKKVTLIAPEKGCWGDFEGDILFTSETGEVSKISFRVHVPSIWEKLTWFAIALISILVFILIALSILWGYLKSPIGVLRPVSSPPGAPLGDDITLSKVKRNIWQRCFHWKKNIVKLGSNNADIKLATLPAKMEVMLIFHRFGGDYIKNMSPKESGYVITVNAPDVDIDIERRPGASYRLSHGLRIKIQDYEFIYENIS